MLKKNEIKVGDTHSEKIVEDLKRTQIVQYAGASGDYNPLHSDDKFTKEIAGYPGVFAHGMLSMGMTGKMLTNFVGDGTLKKYGVRFTNQVWPGDSLESTATIIDIKEENGEALVEIAIETKNQDGATVITGSATAIVGSYFSFMNNSSIPEVGGRSAKFALILLVFVYVFNFIDRQILTILAEDLKADLNISDSDIGFLYGTAFAVFYSVVGIPMGKLADTWNRKNLISLGLAFWSLMTFLSGTAKSFLSLSIYRFGVGIGESSASPASYSLLSDYFSPKVRATVLSIYASGLYIGSGIGIFIGGLIVDNWNEAFPIISEAPFGLKGWQVAFMAVGLPGILLALLTWQIKEPPRGLSEGLAQTKKENPLKAAFGELVGLTPIGLLQAENAQKELIRNFALLVFVLSGAYWLIQTTGDYLQWIAFGIGFYIVCNWIQGLRIRDKVAFELMFKSKALLLGLLAFPFITFVTYALGAFGPAFYIRNFGMTASEVGVIYGLITAFGSMVGVIGGGFVGDKLREKYTNGKLYLIMASAFGTAITGLGFLYSPEANVSFTWKFFYHVSSTAWLGCAASTVTELVLPRLRAVASAFFILMLSMGGLALGPYLTGMLSDIYTIQFLAEGINQSTAEAVGLKQALSQSLIVLLVPIILLGFACRFLKKDEDNLFEKARNLGEAI